MRFSTVPIIAICLFALLTAAWAQTHEDLGRCRIITDSARRLACYDAIPLSATAPRSKYEPVQLAELRTYALSYRDRLVEIVGWIRPEREDFLLGSDANDGSPFPVDLRLLTRQQRDSIAQQCPAGCEATIQGRVGPVNFVTGIVAETLVVH
jgi:hypothetical protein